MDHLKLTQKEIHFFEENGYLLIENLIDEGMIDYERERDFDHTGENKVRQ